ncbi:inactive ribonuclease-like protein 10 [Petaurus breviceps papuanus]|uniref:inactive ribonuclease-like protein 10 n=1 Tax=Petaurus breviceps papuanus TaxID=3040969 RepID=UPI0036D95EE0
MNTVLKIFPMLLFLLGLAGGHQSAPAILEDSQELLNQLWASDSWEEAAEDWDGTKAMEAQEAAENDMLLLDSIESPLAEAFLREDEVLGEELVHDEDVSYLRQVQFNRDCNIMMAQKSVCKVKHTFIHENLDTVKAIWATPSIPCKKENKCHQNSEPLKLTVCQLTKDIVFPKKCYYQSTPLIVTITIACDGMDPESFNY